MKAFKIIGAIVAMFVVAVVVIANVLPSAYRVERTIDIAAPPAMVFAEVNALRRWSAWSPWVANDPTIDNEYSGPESGVGASVSWTSEHSGTGKQTIARSEAPSRIELDLDFGDQGTSLAYFQFDAAAGGTHVTWGLKGDMGGPIGGVIAAQMDRMVGGDYTDGLARLKRHVEGLPTPAADTKPDSDADAGTEAAE